MAAGTLDDLEVIGSDLEPIPAPTPPPNFSWVTQPDYGFAESMKGPLPPGTSLLGGLDEFANVARGAVADIGAGLRAIGTGPKEAAAFSGNLPAALSGEELPVDAALKAAAEEAKFRGEAPTAAVVGNISQNLAGTAPLAAAGAGLPSIAQKILGAGFIGQQIFRDAPRAARELGDELGKPESEQDPDKIARLKGELITIGGFTGVGALGAKRLGRNVALTPGDALRIFARDIPAAELPQGLVSVGPSRQPMRQLGIRVPQQALDLEPEFPALASEALRQASPIHVQVPGEQSALDVLRDRFTRPTAPRVLAERPGGGPATGGQVSFAGPAESTGIPSARQSALVQTIQSTAGLPQPPDMVQRIMGIVNNNDRLSLEQMRSEVRAEPGAGVRSSRNEILRVIDQRLNELETGKPHNENEAIRQIISTAQEQAKPQAERAPPTVEVHPTPSGILLPTPRAPGEPIVTPEPKPFEPQPGTGKNKGRYEIPGLGSFRSPSEARAFADRLQAARLTPEDARAAYNSGGRLGLEMLIRRRTGKTPESVFPEGSKAKASAEVADDVAKRGVRPFEQARYEKSTKQLIDAGFTDYSDWANEMIKRHGQAVKPKLAQLWADANVVVEPAEPIAPPPTPPEPPPKPAAKAPQKPPAKGVRVEPEPFPESPAVLAHEGANIIDAGAKSWNTFSLEMLRKYGTKINPMLKKLWVDSIETLRARKQREGTLSGSRFERWADETIKRWKSLGVRPVGGDELLAAYAIKGAAILERGVRNFADWSVEMVKQFGDAIRPHLQNLWDRINQPTEKGVPDATTKGQEQGGIQQQRERVDAQRVSAEAGAGDRLQREAAQRAQGAQADVQAEITQQLNLSSEDFLKQFGKGKKGVTESAYELGERVPIEQLPLLEQAHETAITRLRASRELKDFQAGMAEGMRKQYFNEAIKWRQALEEAKNSGATTLDQFGEIEQKYGVGLSKRGQELMDAFQREIKKETPEPTVESVTPLEPSSGTPVSEAARTGNRLSATDALIERLESLRFDEANQGRLYSLPHPDAIKAIGKTAWNNAIDVAIAAIKAGKKIGEAVTSAIDHLKRNVANFDEQQIRNNLSYILREEAPRGGTAGAAGAVARPSRRPINAGLDDVYKRFVPEPKESKPIGQRITDVYEALRTGFSSKFRPLDRLAEDIAKAYGGTAKSIAHLFEQLKGSSGKADADVYRFDQDVSKLVGHDTKDFNAYMFLTRSLERLRRDYQDIQRAMGGEEVRQLNRRAVSDYTIPELEAKLRTLNEKLTPEQRDRFKIAAQRYQEHMDVALRLQVESGRMSRELYDAIKSQNDFYAPFKILKYLDETSRPPGAGTQIDTLADYTKAMKGIQDPNFKLGDMLSAARQNIVLSRVLAEKNSKMLKFAEVANTDTRGLFVRRLGRDQDAPAGMQSVNVMVNGEPVRYAVNKDVAAAVKLYDTRTNEVLSKFLRLAAIPFRAGATTANIAFQGVNLLLADLPRSALMTKTGLGGPYGILSQPGKFAANFAIDLVRFPIHFVQSMFDAMESNLIHKDTKMALDYLDSGAAGAVIQDYLTPELLRWRQTTPRSIPMHIARSILAKPAEFAKAIEETNKMLGMRRAKLFYGVESGKEMAERIPEAVTEVRRFSGSPDFGRMGKAVEALRLNLLFMFFNARIQGAVADIGRLAGRDGVDMAATAWFRMAAFVGVPTAMAYYLNQLPQYKADYDARPQNEKDNYILIPKDSYITDDQGNKMRDFWRIPKRDVVQIVANLTESALKFAQQRNPQQFWAFAVDSMENLSPLNIRGDTAQERVESIESSLNPIFKAPIEFGTGRDTFRHRDIVPDTMKKLAPKYPEDQYLERTPELYRKLAHLMPDVAPAALRSPLMLENLTQNMTAGLIQQFLPSRNIPGRSGLEANPLLRRFQAAPYAEDPAQMQEIKNLQSDAAKAFIDKDRAAKAMILNKQTIQEVAQAVAAKYGTNDNASSIFERATDLWLAEKNGITRPERQVLNLPVAQRAQYILNKLKPLDPQAKMDLLMDYQRKRILSEGVIESMVQQLENPSQPPAR